MRVLVTEPLSERGLGLLREDFQVDVRPELAKDGRISWVSIVAARLASVVSWRAREARGERAESVSSALAPAIGRIGR